MYNSEQFIIELTMFIQLFHYLLRQASRLILIYSWHLLDYFLRCNVAASVLKKPRLFPFSSRAMLPFWTATRCLHSAALQVVHSKQRNAAGSICHLETCQSASKPQRSLCWDLLHFHPFGGSAFTAVLSSPPSSCTIELWSFYRWEKNHTPPITNNYHHVYRDCLTCTSASLGLQQT